MGLKSCFSGIELLFMEVSWLNMWWMVLIYYQTYRDYVVEGLKWELTLWMNFVEGTSQLSHKCNNSDLELYEIVLDIYITIEKLIRYGDRNLEFLTCQVGDGKLRGRDMQHLIGAFKLGTKYKHWFQVDSVWSTCRISACTSSSNADDSRGCTGTVDHPQQFESVVQWCDSRLAIDWNGGRWSRVGRKRMACCSR